MSWATFISAGIGPWVKKGASSLGLGLITYAGFQAIKDQLAQAVATMWGGIPSDIYSVIALAGFVDAVGVWMGAITTAVALLSFKRLGVLQA